MWAGSRSAHGSDGGGERWWGGGGRAWELGKKNPGNLFCRYADMKAFEEPEWEVKKTDLNIPLLVSPHAAKHKATKI